MLGTWRTGFFTRAHRRCLAFWCLAWILASGLVAQDHPLRVRRIGADEGLTQSTVFAVVQDRQGFMWFGTQDGLHRYDGERFTIYRPQQPHSGCLPHGMILSLALDAQGRLWVGTFRGLSRFDPASGRFVCFDAMSLDAAPEDGSLAPSVIAPSVISLLPTPEGGLWVGTLGHGLWRFDADGETVRHWRRGGPEAEILPHDSVWSLLADPDGTLWIGTGGGLVRFDPETGRHEVFSAQPQDPKALPDSRVLSLYRDRQGELWVGTGGGLARFDPVLKQFQVLRHDPADPSSLGHRTVRAIHEDRRGDLWVGTGGGGLDRFDRRRQVFEHHVYNAADRDTLSHDEIWSLTEDRSGLLWVGTAYGGVNVVESRPKFQHRRPDGQSGSKVVRSLLVDHEGDLWVGVDGGGIFKSEGRRGPVERFDLGPEDLRSGRIWHLFEDRRQRLWIGTERGLYRRVGDTITFWGHRPGDATSLAPGGVRRSLQDDDGDLWMAHFGGGLSRLPAASLDTENPSPFVTYRHRSDDATSLRSDLVLTLMEDAQGRLWIGTVEGLARHLGDGRFIRYPSRTSQRDGLAGSMVRSLLQDREGRLWVGTDHGLDLLEEPSKPPGVVGIRHFDHRQGLPNDTIYAMLEDAEGRLWLSTNRGISRLDPTSDQVLNFDPMDGLQGWEFNGGSATVGPEGEMYFGGIHGFNVLHPADIELRQFIPPVVFTGYRLENEPVELEGPMLQGGQVQIRPEVATVTFEFASLDFADPPSNRYRYRLEGLNRTWIELGHDNEATFTHLEPGSYRLEIQGSNSDGVWNENATRLRLVVLPAWWQTWWAHLAYTLAALLVLGVLLWQYWRRESLRKEINRVLRTSQQRLELALRGSGDGLWDWDIPSGRIFRAQVAELLGLDPDAIAEDHGFRRQRIHPDDAERVETAIQDHLEGKSKRYEAEYRLRHNDGQWRWILDRGVVVQRDRKGRPMRMAGTCKDITRLKEVEEKLRLWATVFESINEGVMITDTENNILAVNSAFCEITGFARDDVLGQHTKILETAEGSPELYGEIRRSLAEHGSWRGEVRQVRGDGEAFLAWADFNPVVDEGGGITHFVCVFSDITQRKKSEEELRYLASFDVVTGLPNRVHFLQQLHKALQDVWESQRPLAVLFSDLDHFKTVNDTLGHAVGDHLLQEAGRRLQAAVRRQDLVARLGGDEFTVLLRDINDEGDVVRVADRILEAFGEPFELGDRNMTISTSVGISLFPADGSNADELLEKADIAMYEAKGAGRSQYRFFDSAMGQQPRRRLMAKRSRPASSE